MGLSPSGSQSAHQWLPPCHSQPYMALCSSGRATAGHWDNIVHDPSAWSPPFTTQKSRSLGIMAGPVRPPAAHHEYGLIPKVVSPETSIRPCARVLRSFLQPTGLPAAPSSPVTLLLHLLIIPATVSATWPPYSPSPPGRNCGALPGPGIFSQ